MSFSKQKMSCRQNRALLDDKYSRQRAGLDPADYPLRARSKWRLLKCLVERLVWIRKKCSIFVYRSGRQISDRMLAAHGTSKEASKAKRKSTSALRGPLLGLLINQEQPSHIYKLKGLLAQCLPTWRVERSHVGYTLGLLEKEGLACSIDSVETGGTVFAPTAQTRFALDEWMEQSVSTPPVREELHARIVSSCPHHAPMLLKALDAFERRCYARLKETPGAESSMGSWRSLMIDAVRVAEDEDIEAKIRWAQSTRKRIVDYGRQSQGR